MQPSDVKQRAAWAWARSSELYDRCATDLEQSGHTTKALNLHNVKEKGSVLEQVVRTLRKRAKLARWHAEKLLSETTADSFLKWTLTGDGLSSGKSASGFIFGLGWESVLTSVTRYR
jgi:hypothetical protein